MVKAKDKIMKRVHKIFFFILGILTVILIELNPASSTGAYRMIRSQAKGMFVHQLADYTFSLENIDFLNTL